MSVRPETRISNMIEALQAEGYTVTPLTVPPPRWEVRRVRIGAALTPDLDANFGAYLANGWEPYASYYIDRLSVEVHLLRKRTSQQETP